MEADEAAGRLDFGSIYSQLVWWVSADYSP